MLKTKQVTGGLGLITASSIHRCY